MAKNKVFLTVLVVLLAGCAVLIGCAGEGAGGVSKSVDNSVNVSDNSGEEIPGEPIGGGGTEEGKFPPWELGKFPGLDAETELQIMQDRFDGHREANPNCAGCEEGKHTIDSFHILRYLGTYNGCVVIQFPYSPMTIGWHEEIGGINFWEPAHSDITVWKDGVFYTMTALYERGLLTREDLLMVYDIHEDLKEAYFENKQ